MHLKYFSLLKFHVEQLDKPKYSAELCSTWNTTMLSITSSIHSKVSEKDIALIKVKRIVLKIRYD